MPRGWGREATKERGWRERALRAGVSEVVYAFLSVELSYVYKHQKRY